jgi:hypothetical protein
MVESIPGRPHRLLADAKHRVLTKDKGTGNRTLLYGGFAFTDRRMIQNKSKLGGE